MEYSSTKPLALQVYKTAAEFKAHRLNRSEQCRLTSAHSTLTREARTLEKDYKLTKARLESRYVRRFSVHDAALIGAGFGSNSPRMSVGDLSRRRASEAVITSRRRHSEWSITDSMTRDRLLQRRQTVGGALSAFGPRTRASARERHSIVDISECDFCEKVSKIVEDNGQNSDKSVGQSCVHFDLPDAKSDSRSAAAHVETTDPNMNDLSEVKDEQKVVGSRSGQNGPTLTRRATVHVTDNEHVIQNGSNDNSVNGYADSAQSQNNTTAGTEPNSDSPRAQSAAARERQTIGDTGTGKTSARFNTRVKAKSAFYPRRGSKPSSVRYADFLNDDQNDGGTDGPCNGTNNDSETVSAGEIKSPAEDSQTVKNSTKRDQEIRRPQKTKGSSEIDLALSRPTQNPNNGKSPSNVSQLDSINQANASWQNNEEVIRDHMQNCSSAASGRSRQQSVVFGDSRTCPLQSLLDSRRQSLPVAQFALQGKISNFLEKQREFNQRFPLERHEVKSLQCARPDLLHASRKKDELNRESNKRKVEMIEEVMSKLGLAQTDGDMNFLPTIKRH